MAMSQDALDMYTRDRATRMQEIALAYVAQFQDQGGVTVIKGPRRCGITTMAKKLASLHPTAQVVTTSTRSAREWEREPVTYINLDRSVRRDMLILDGADHMPIIDHLSEMARNTGWIVLLGGDEYTVETRDLLDKMGASVFNM
jgi:predicted AAA+ superfamily ATPase